ncbi:MAG: FmdB family zinc ribbon protein [Candidatus Binataceae bacterium]
MPIYECHCMKCELTFEVIAPVGAARRRHACPECGRLSPRIVSTFAIVSGGAAGDGNSNAKIRPANGAKAAVRRKNQPPLCLQYPHIPLLCHMDEPSAQRWVAHYNGRGAEYDDKKDAREELRQRRGLPPPAPAPAGQVHGHAHAPGRHAPMGAAKHKAAAAAASANSHSYAH